MKHASAVVHAATLHKPHVVTHSWQDFMDTNVSGTLVLLKAAISAGVPEFHIREHHERVRVIAEPRRLRASDLGNRRVSGEAKEHLRGEQVMAENLCELAHKEHRLPVMVLRTSRFFPEDDDSPEVSRQYETANTQANELLYRRVDIEDAISAIMRALERAADIGFSRFIVSATSPFKRDDLSMLGHDAPSVVRRMFPEVEATYAMRDWKFFPKIDRVYVNDRARRELGWTPKYDFAYVLKCLRANQDFRSSLAREVGSKGYHDRAFADGPYPIA